VALTALAVLLIAAGLLLALRLGGSGAHAAGSAPAGRPPAAAGPRGASRTPAPRTPASLPPARATPSAPARPGRHSDPFGPAAVALAASRPGMMLAAVYDVRTGQAWRLGHGPPQAEASIVKVDILETLLARYQAAGSALPAADLPVAQRMIDDSDNDAATSLWYAAGGPARIQSYNAAAGLRHTAASRCVDCPGFPWPGWGLTTTTPGDQITLLRQLIEPSSLLSAGRRGYVLRLMEQVTPAQRWGVSGGAPPGVTVALKNGWLPLNSTDTDWQVNSMGWISGDGRDYLMAVLTTGSLTEQDGIAMIGELAAEVWHNMR
jgi:hypothetical protein